VCVYIYIYTRECNIYMCPYIDQLKKYVEIEEPKGSVEITFFLVINAEKGLTCLRDYHLKGLIFNKKAYER